MNTRHGQKIDGRDATALFTGSKTDWSDMAFIRSTSAGKPWLCAVSDRYKLVYSDMGDPWLFDLERDPDEMTNLFNNAASKKIVKSHPKADLIIANNVLAHIPNLKDFINASLLLLKEDGIISIEVPHILNLIKKKQFDTIYDLSLIHI
mgnify:CR=1 FL=1